MQTGFPTLTALEYLLTEETRLIVIAAEGVNMDLLDSHPALS
jgi:hypothetical protein